jgi:hypothetical protein
VGSVCVDDGTAGGPTCKKVCTAQGDCPFNTYCNDGLANGLPVNWCAPTTTALSQSGGQWGASCLPSGACDTGDGFACFGTSPTDATAFCTMFDCSRDRDCPGGWWCATVNVAPNVTTTKLTFGPTHTVCLPRRYCAPCQTDHDCFEASDATAQHCVMDTGGSGFCTPQCGSSADCQQDAICTKQWGICTQKACQADGDCQAASPRERCSADGVCRFSCSRDSDCPTSNGAVQHCRSGGCVAQACQSDDDCPPTAGTFQHCNAGACTPECSSNADCDPTLKDQTCVPLSVCVPRAGVCAGDGTFCSPCRSDADCGNGYCLSSPYSKELFCSQTLQGGTCTTNGPQPAASCPSRNASANYKVVACTPSASPFSPANQCVGEVSLGKAQGAVQYVPGCWTLNQ